MKEKSRWPIRDSGTDNLSSFKNIGIQDAAISCQVSQNSPCLAYPATEACPFSFPFFPLFQEKQFTVAECYP
jgi:hypothetical protein